MAASQSQYRIVISLRDGGGILVERQLELGGQFKTIDRYNTHDLTKELKRTDPWIAQVIELCSQPTAAIEISIPKVPPLLPTQAERLAAYEAEARAREMQAQHDAEFRNYKYHSEETLKATGVALSTHFGDGAFKLGENAVHLADTLEGIDELS